MRVFYKYEIGGVVQNDNPYSLVIENSEKGLNRELLMDHLKQEHALVSEETIVHYFNEECNAYIPLKRGDKIPPREEVKVLIRKGNTFQVQALLDRIHTLENQVKSLRSTLDSRVASAPVPTLVKPSITQPSYSQLDLVMLHAAPLVYQSVEGTFPIQDSSLDFEGERRNFLKFLEEKNVGLDLRFEAATTKNLHELLSYKPKVIYLSGQSFRTEEEFVLGFENQIGVLDQVNENRLKGIFNSVSPYLQVVILKCDYSEDVANILLNAGFSCVVGVSDTDNSYISQKFVAHFCTYLLKGESIRVAFNKAENTIADNEKIGACCCSHSHKPHCNWLKQLDLTTKVESHKEHTPTCECENKHKAIHRGVCRWAVEFCITYTPERVLLDTQKLPVCCCCDFEHGNLKFKLFFSDDSVQDQVLFEESSKSELEIRAPFPTHLKPPYIEKNIIGRRKVVYDLVDLACNNRCVQAIGVCGTGKSIIAKKAAQYIYERRVFKEGVVYIDLRMKTDIVFMYRYIASALNLPSVNNESELCKALESLEILIILDNVDPLIKKENQTFINNLNNIVANTSSPKLLICSQKELKLENSQKYEILPLSEQEAAAMLTSLIEPTWKGKVDVKYPERFIDTGFLKQISLIPSAIQQVAPIFKQKTLDQVLLEYRGNHSFQPLDRSLELSFLHARNQNPHIAEFLHLLSYLNAGEFIANLKFLYQSASYNYSEIFSLLKNEKTTLGNWFLHIDEKQEHVLCKNNVLEYMESNFQNKPQFAITCIKHLACFSRALLDALLQDPKFSVGAEVRTSLLFVNAGIDYGIWVSKFPEQSQAMLECIKNPKQMFNQVLTNFWCYVNIEYLERVLESCELDQETSLALGEMILCTVSIFHLMGQVSEALVFLERAETACFKYRLSHTHNAIKLVKASLLALNNSQYYQALESIDSSMKYFTETEDSEGLGECYFLKGVIKEQRQPAEMTLVRSASSDIEGDLVIAKAKFREAKQDLGCARAQLAYAENKLHEESNELFIKNELEAAIEVFREKGKNLWQVRALIYLSDWYFYGKNCVKARDILLEAHQIARKVKSRKQEVEITEKIRKTNDVIRKSVKNVISLLKAFPLVEEGTKSKMQRAGAICRFPSMFRQDLQAELQSCGKEVCVRFDTGTLETLSEYLLQNCKVLHLASEMPSSNFLCLEANGGLAEKLSFEEVKEKIQGDLNQFGVQLLVLAMPFSIGLGESAHKNLKVPHVIAFGMLDYPKDGDPVHVYLMFEQAIHTFCVSFYTHLTCKKTIRNAYLLAKQKMEDFIEERVSRFGFLEVRGATLRQWWNEHHRNEPVLINEVSPAHDQPIFEDCEPDVSFGTNMIDMSPPRSPCNITKSELVFIGRHLELYKVVKEFSKETACVHICGSKGLGKTEFVRHLGYFLNTRGYFPDGIYLLDLEGKSELSEVYEMFQGVGLAFYSDNSDPKKFLFEQKMLLILDNCDALMTKAEITFNRLLNMFLSECKISLIVTSCAQLLTNNAHSISRFNLRHLNLQESYQLLSVYSPNFTSQNLEAPVVRKDFNSVVDKILKESQGVPSKIIAWSRTIDTESLDKVKLMFSFKRFSAMTRMSSEPNSPGNQTPQLELKRSSTIEESFRAELESFSEDYYYFSSGKGRLSLESIPRN